MGVRAEFAQRVLRWQAFDYQVPAIDSEAPIVTVVGGRRSGKTEAAKRAMLRIALSHAGCQVLVIGANEPKARELVADMARIVRRAGLKVDVDEGASRLRFAGNGSEVLALPPTPGQVRGYGERVMGLWIDEPQIAVDRLWQDARFVMLDNLERGCQCWLTGTPAKPSDDHFFFESWQRGMDGDPDYASFQWPTALNPKLPVGWIERERERLTLALAAAELDGEWTESAGRMFSYGLLASATADLTLPAWGALRGPARLAFGVDWGVSFDRSAAVALARLPVWSLNPERDRRPVFGVVGVKVWPAGMPLTDVVQEVLPPDAVPGVVAPECNSVGAMPAESLERQVRARWEAISGYERVRTRSWAFRAITTSAQSKAVSYGAILGLLERGQLVLPRDPDLLRQLAGIRFEHGQRGHVRIEAESAQVHDDVADALAMATVPYSNDAGRWRTMLGNLAARATPDAHADDPDVPVVLTGGGLRLPAAPVLQSIDGSEVTPPVGVGLDETSEQTHGGLAGALLALPREEVVWHL